VVIPPALLDAVEREAAPADKGKAFFVDLAARQIAIAREMGYAGIYVGGPTKCEDFFAILEKAAEYGREDWHALVASTTYTVPGTWYAYRSDRATGLSSSEPVPFTRKGDGILGGPGDGMSAGTRRRGLAPKPSVDLRSARS